MKYVSQNSALQPSLRAWAGEKDLVVAEHFFWFAGTTLQKSHEGILRSLLRQILTQRPDITPIIFPGLAHHLEQLEKTGGLANVSILQPELDKAFDMLTHSIPKNVVIFLLIDGIDEYSGDLYEFCRLLMRLGKCPSIKILMSSRPIPACSHLFARCQSLKMQDLTHVDIEKYIDDQLMEDPLLQDMDVIESGFADEVKRTLVEKASGVFLWIVLVVKDMLVGLGNYDDREALELRIERLPSDLENLYDHMLARLDKEHQQEGSMLLQIIKRALNVQKHDLGALQLSFAKCPRPDPPLATPTRVLSAKEEALRVKMIDGRLRSRCCGLVEVQSLKLPKTANDIARVDFLHRTVVEYLNQYSVWESIAKVCPMRTSDMDLILLASCLATSSTEDLSIPDPFTRISKLFEHCLIYSKELQRIGEFSYVEYLDAAEQRCLDRTMAFEANLTNYPRSYYNNRLYDQRALDIFYEHGKFQEQRAVLGIIHEAEMNDNIAMFCIATSGLHQYWRHKVAKYPLTPSSTTNIMLPLIAAICRDQSLLATYGHSIEVLLENADPNLPSAHIDAKRLHEIYGLGPVRHGVYSKSSLLSPWNLWLGAYCGRHGFVRSPYSALETVQGLRLMAALVNGGANLQSNNNRKSVAIAAVRHDLQQFKTLSIQLTERDQNLLEQALALFDLADLEEVKAQIW